MFAAAVSVYSEQSSAKVFPDYLVVSSPRDQIRFQCYYKGQPSTTNPTYWSHNDVILPCDHQQRISGCKDTLVLFDFRFTDSGRYQCHVVDSVNTSIAWGEIRGRK